MVRILVGTGSCEIFYFSRENLFLIHFCNDPSYFIGKIKFIFRVRSTFFEKTAQELYQPVETTVDVYRLCLLK